MIVYCIVFLFIFILGLLYALSMSSSQDERIREEQEIEKSIKGYYKHGL